MNKPTFEELENKIATQKTTIERLKKRSDQDSSYARCNMVCCTYQ